MKNYCYHMTQVTGRSTIDNTENPEHTSGDPVLTAYAALSSMRTRSLAQTTLCKRQLFKSKFISYPLHGCCSDFSLALMNHA